MKRRDALALGLTLLTAAPAFAADDDAAQAERWQDLSHALFGNRPVADGTGVIALDAPGRAMDAALVPVTITLAGQTAVGKITAVWLLVDGNPSPLAGTFRFGPASDVHMLKTRIRVDQYTLVHAVAEAEDGRLFAVARYVKAAGGCSAPSSKDAAVAMSRLGKMRLRLDDNHVPAAGETGVAQLLISHPNNNGMQMDQVTHNYIPARYIQDISIRYGDALVLQVDADISMSEDPVITFGFKADGAGPLRVTMQDSTRATWQQDFPLQRPA